MSDHCPACRVLRELTEHRDNTHADWSLRRGTLNFARVIAARACPNYAPKPTETEETPVRDHDTCEEAINAALANGNDGRAEFLAVRCDREHGDQTSEEAS